MTSAARFKANRQNARASTGPTSSAGKARASRNACRHGLSIPARSDPAYAEQIAALAHSLVASTDASLQLIASAYKVAEAHIDLERVRGRHQQTIEQYRQRACGPRTTAGAPEPDHRSPLSAETEGSMLSDLIAEIHALDRYEQRALSRRNKATLAFDGARILEELKRPNAIGGHLGQADGRQAARRQTR